MRHHYQKSAYSSFLLLAAFTVLFAGRISSAAASDAVLSAPLANPITEGLKVWDPTARGYVAEEYLLSGNANIYEPVTMADANSLDRDNAKDLAKQDSYDRVIVEADVPYVTRIVVYRPADMSRFSGNVVVESFHPLTGGASIVWSDINSYFMTNGDVYVGVSHPETFKPMKEHGADRYGSMTFKQASQLWGMIADTGRLLKAGEIPSVAPEYVFLTGYSFTGVTTSTFANYHHDETRLADGSPVFDGYIPMANAMYVRPLDVPVLRMNNDSDFNVFGALETRGDVSEKPSWQYRLYEVVGAAHATIPVPEAGAAKRPRPDAMTSEHRPASLPAKACYDSFPAGSVPNDFPTRLVQAALFRNMYDWVRGGTEPPKSMLIEVDAEGEQVKDLNGNAKGGLRLSHVSVPMNEFGMGKKRACFLFGYRLPLTADQKKALYGSHGAYVAAVTKAAEKLVEDRFILESGAAELIAWAKKSEAF